MDHLIKYKEVAEFLKNPPTLSPRPDFEKLRAMQKHMVKGLKQLVCPQSAIHGWLGLVLLPMVYALLMPNPFIAPPDPGAVAVYAQFALPVQIKTTDAMFVQAQNNYGSYKNIMRACFCMLDENVSDQFKVSNVPTLIGWNAIMTIQEISGQLHGTYGKPDTMTLLTNGTHFRSPFNPADALESLFYRIEQCQEIQVLAQDPYTDTQIINNAIRLLMQSSIFAVKEFDDWEAITPKTYPALKTFVGAAYICRMLAMQLRSTAGQMGYTPKIRLSTTYLATTMTPRPPTTSRQN
jgi:hypothetical protein